MSVGGDIVSEIIALLQPLKNVFNATIREYIGELDKVDSDEFVLPAYLFAVAAEPPEEGELPVSTVLVEFNGIEHEAQDAHNVVYHSTYRFNIWLIAGFNSMGLHKQGGENLEQEYGYQMYDAILDLIAARKILKNAETVRLEKGTRVFFGISSAVETPFDGPMATVYKLEFSIKTQSLWEVFSANVRVPTIPSPNEADNDDEAASAVALEEESTDSGERITAEGDPWYLAAGSVNEESGFSVNAKFTINDAYVDFNERAITYLPNDRTGWRGSFPGVQLPTAIFPCNDKLSTVSNNPIPMLTDVVDGYRLCVDVTEVDGVLYDRIASGLRTYNKRGMVKYSPYRGIELATSSTGAIPRFIPIEHDESETSDASIEPEYILDPVEDQNETVAVSGYVIGRFRAPTSETMLMGKMGNGPLNANSDIDVPKGWALTMTANGDIRLTVRAGGATVSVYVNGDHSDEWTGIFFSMVRLGSDDPNDVLLKLFTPRGFYVGDGAGHSAGASGRESAGTWTSGWHFPIAEEGAAEARPTIDSAFSLGGLEGHLAFAAYWQGPKREYDVGTLKTYKQLWRGLLNPVNVYRHPGFVLTRGGVMAWPVTRSLSGTETVCEFASSSDVVPVDHYTVNARSRVLPHDINRTNLIRESNNLNGDEWAVSSSLPKVVGPDGMASAWLCAASGTVSQTVDATADGVHVLSVWARSEKDGGVVFSIGGTVSETKPVGPGWRRLSFASAASMGAVEVSIQAVGQPVALWGPQFELGASTSAYILNEQSSGSMASGIVDCYVDWTVMPAPTAKSGKVQAVLIPDLAMFVSPGTEPFGAFQVYQAAPPSGTHQWLTVNAVTSTLTDGYAITWQLEGSVLSQVVSSPPIRCIPGTPITTALVWRGVASDARVELWIDGEVVATGGLSLQFETDPTICHLMRRGAVGATPSEFDIVEASKWIGACKEIRWWK